MNRHCLTLENAYQQFGVSPSIIVAILMVETQLGTYTGKYLTINVLSTMAVASDPQVQKEIFRSLDTENTSMESQREIIKRLKKRALRGYRELKAFLDYLKESGKDPFMLKGSREGAIGIPQFLPSNISRYGQDGNGDGIVDLFDHDDAIFSVAAFLQANHWKQARTDSEKKDVLLKYNYSIYYVNTVCSLADKLDRLASIAETQSVEKCYNLLKKRFINQ
jgi:membrane-bound lytic murein transglycosylase B